MKKKYLVFTALLIFLVLFASWSMASSHNSVDEAKGLIAEGMWRQAIELLDKRIGENPDDAEAHFQLGVCFVNTNNNSEADEHFATAARLKLDYGHKIGQEYKKTGIGALSEGGIGKALILFKKAAQYEPNLKAEIAKECFAAGKSYLDQQRGNEAAGLLSAAVDYDKSLNAEKGRLTQDYGKKLLAMAKEKPKKERRRYVDEASKYLTQQDIDEILPPPTWKMVFEKVYYGKGVKGDKPIPTVRFTEEILYGDKIIITGKAGEGFFVADGDRWMEYKNRYEVMNRYSGSEPAFLYVQTREGTKLRLEIQRFVTSY